MKTRTVSFGLLIIRVGIGLALIIHGAPILFGGGASWESTGSAMSVLGINFSTKIFGFTAGLFQVVGGLFFLSGFLLRFTCMGLAAVMAIATIYSWVNGAEFVSFSHPLELFVLFIGMIFVGAGRYSLDEKFFPEQRSVDVVKAK